MRMARSIAHALAVVLIDRVPSVAARCVGADLVDAGQAVQEGPQSGSDRASSESRPGRRRCRRHAERVYAGADAT